MKYGISAEGATVPRQVMEHVVRNPCKREPSRIKVLKGRQKNQNNQSQHHKTMSFHEEYESFLKAYEIQYDERYAFDD